MLAQGPAPAHRAASLGATVWLRPRYSSGSYASLASQLSTSNISTIGSPVHIQGVQGLSKLGIRGNGRCEIGELPGPDNEGEKNFSKAFTANPCMPHSGQRKLQGYFQRSLQSQAFAAFLRKSWYVCLGCCRHGNPPHLAVMLRFCPATMLQQRVVCRRSCRLPADFPQCAQRGKWAAVQQPWSCYLCTRHLPVLYRYALSMRTAPTNAASPDTISFCKCSSGHQLGSKLLGQVPQSSLPIADIAS